MSESQLPARIDRAALERIVQRAAELQTGDRDIGDALTPEQVLALGREVGIPDHYIRQAMLEERTRLGQAPAKGVLDQLAGPAVMLAQRVVAGSPDAVERRLLRYVEENELLALQRHQPGRISWEPLGGLQSAIRRSTAALGGGRRPFLLARADQVTATVTPLEEGYCHVSLTASSRAARSQRVGGAAAATSVGLAGAAVLFALDAYAAVALAPVPLSLGLGWGILRTHRPLGERIRLGLECALDHLERGGVKPCHAPGEEPTGLLGQLAREVRKALR